MEAGKAFAIHVLSRMGFEADEIPTGSGRRADLKIADSESAYHIEVKEKFEGDETATERVAVLKTGELYEQSDLLAHDNRISGILRDARKQLDQTPKNGSTFQLIWFHADGIDADTKYRQAMATFYGQVALSPIWEGKVSRKEWNESQPDTLPTCFYFDYAASFAMPTVEALILTDRSQLQLCLNEFSLRSNEFRASAFCRKVIELDGLFDPVALAASGQIIACRATIPRKDDNEIARALKEQTGVLYTPIRLTRYSCSVAVKP